MKYGVETFTGIRPTADLTVANYIGAIKPLLSDEAEGKNTAVFLAEMHAATTDKPHEVMENSHSLAHTLIACGVEGEIYSQRFFQSDVATVETSLRGLTTVSRLLRLPTLKEKVTNSDNAENANVALAMYPMMMAADIVLARPEEVPTGKDQAAHLEVTNELIRSFNREHSAEIPLPQARTVKSSNILSLDGTGRKMSKSIPGGAIFIAEGVDLARRKIMKAKSASGPGPDMDQRIDNLSLMAAELSSPNEDNSEMLALADEVKNGEPKMKDFKELVGDRVVSFLITVQQARNEISDADVVSRVQRGNEWFAPIAEETVEAVTSAYWNKPSE